jgi:hypothetical protein
MPGSVDPFLQNTAHDEFHPGIDLSGVLILATLVKRLLASSELDAIDTKLILMYPACTSFTFSVLKMQYYFEGTVGEVFQSATSREKVAQT